MNRINWTEWAKKVQNGDEWEVIPADPRIWTRARGTWKERTTGLKRVVQFSKSCFNLVDPVFGPFAA